PFFVHAPRRRRLLCLRGLRARSKPRRPPCPPSPRRERRARGPSFGIAPPNSWPNPRRRPSHGPRRPPPAPGQPAPPPHAARTAELTRPVPAEPTVRPVPNDSDLIRETLREYERALDTLDVDRYVRIFPSFAGDRRRELESSWRGLKSQHVELEIHQIEPTGDHAV